MTLRRATLYIGGGSLLVAWFSSAASVSQMRTPPRAFSEGQSGAAPTDGVAEAVQAQSRRLRQRLATAPLPPQPLRNPFAFRPAPSASPARGAEQSRLSAPSASWGAARFCAPSTSQYES